MVWLDARTKVLVRRIGPGRRGVRVAAWGLAGLGVLVLVGLVALLVWRVPPALYDYVPDAKDRAAAEASTRTGLVAGFAGLAALGSLAVTARTYRLTQQGQIADRYTKAIAQLGDEKLDVRLGGIYALERIAEDSKRDHPTVVEVLSAFVRERTAVTPRVRPVDRRTAHPLSLSSRVKKLGVDVQAALTVLGRLPKRRGVSRGDVGGADLTGANLRSADLTGANLTRANLSGAFLTDADLTGAFLADADLTEAFLAGANLSGASLAGANLTKARDLTQPQVEAAVGDWETKLSAKLRWPSSWVSTQGPGVVD